MKMSLALHVSTVGCRSRSTPLNEPNTANKPQHPSIHRRLPPTSLAFFSMRPIFPPIFSVVDLLLSQTTSINLPLLVQQSISGFLEIDQGFLEID